MIAESDQTIDVGGYVYFPRSAVKMELLARSPKTPSDQACPHGVQFYDVSGEGTTSERAAWSYEQPRASMAQIDHFIGFWGDVSLSD